MAGHMSSDPDLRDGAQHQRIRQELEALLTQPPLDASQRLQRFLRYVVEETLEGRSDQLIGFTIGLDVFDKGEDFDPTTDSIVRVEASRLRRRLREHYAETSRQPRVKISLPKGTYVPEFEHIAPAPVVSKEVAHRPERGPSIAVLPFENYGGDPKDQFFADGLTEETIANLARFKDLFVFSRTTTAKLSRDRADIRQIHHELGVDFVLEGSVRKSDRTVRVTAQLIDAERDGHVLADRFERPCTPEGVFEIQDEIARLVAGRVADRYGPIGRYAARANRAGRSERWETYSWIARFYDYYATHDPDAHREVREGLTQALESDPGSSDGWAASTAVLLDEYRFHLNERPSFPALERALEQALCAVTCDPDNAFAYQVLAMTHFHRREHKEFRIAAERAVELNPGHADALADIGVCYCLLADWDRGLALIDRAIELSPVHPGWYRLARALRYGVTDNAEDAIIELKTAPMPGWFWYHACLAWFYAELGDEDDAVREVAHLLAAYPDFAENAHGELRLWCVHDELAAKMIGGWRNAGLPIA